MKHQELFKDTAWYYSRYRKRYPSSFFEYIVKTFNLNKTSRVLDLGTGTGQIAIPLSRYTKEIIAIDPEKQMLDEGEKIAHKNRIGNIKWVKLRAEEITNEIGVFKITTIGASFHWMDREKVLDKIYKITQDDGGVVIVSDFNRGTSPQNGEAWKKVRKDVITKYLGERRRAGNSFYIRGDDTFEDRLTNSQFGGYEEWKYDFNRTWKLDEVVNFLYSTSFASKRLFGDRLEAFEKELRKELLKLEPEGVFKEAVRLQVLIGKK